MPSSGRPAIDYTSITTDCDLREYCRELAECDSIAFDTEFVSEHTYRPVLCLIQVAAGGRLAVIDAMAVDDVTPFWEAVAREGHQTIVHAGRSEVEFCLHAVGRRPNDLFDVQIAAGLIGLEFPASYRTLISKLLGEKGGGHETRTDWRRRPLSERQIRYALEDARHLHAMRDNLQSQLAQLDRAPWLEEEMAVWLHEVEHGGKQSRWRKVSGSAGLDARSLAIVRELWNWRDTEAARLDKPPRRVLRDDLIVELARRRTADVGRISAVRGFERRGLKRQLDAIAVCVQQALDLPDDDCPQRGPRRQRNQPTILGQFLFAALGSVCRQAGLAPSLVATPSDIRQLIAYRTRGADDKHEPPKLARGWRAEFVGHLFDRLLDGKTAIRIGDPASDHPLIFEPEE